MNGFIETTVQIILMCLDGIFSGMSRLVMKFFFSFLSALVMEILQPLSLRVLGVLPGSHLQALNLNRSLLTAKVLLLQTELP